MNQLTGRRICSVIIHKDNHTASLLPAGGRRAGWLEHRVTVKRKQQLSWLPRCVNKEMSWLLLLLVFVVNADEAGVNTNTLDDLRETETTSDKSRTSLNTSARRKHSSGSHSRSWREELLWCHSVGKHSLMCEVNYHDSRIYNSRVHSAPDGVEKSSFWCHPFRISSTF